MLLSRPFIGKGILIPELAKVQVADQIVEVQRTTKQHKLAPDKSMPRLATWRGQHQHATGRYLRSFP